MLLVTHQPAAPRGLRVAGGTAQRGEASGHGCGGRIFRKSMHERRAPAIWGKFTEHQLLDVGPDRRFSNLPQRVMGKTPPVISIHFSPASKPLCGLQPLCYAARSASCMLPSCPACPCPAVAQRAGGRARVVAPAVSSLLDFYNSLPLRPVLMSCGEGFILPVQ